MLMGSIWAKAAMEQLQVSHRQLSPYNPESNRRAEVAVKSMNWLLQYNTSAQGWRCAGKGPHGGLYNMYNMPEPTTGISPGLALFGCNLWDHIHDIHDIPIPLGTTFFLNCNVAFRWHETWENRDCTDPATMFWEAGRCVSEVSQTG